jgi:hypothetical protein
MDLEFIKVKTEVYTRDIGNKICNTEKENRLGLMVVIMRDNIKME